jgi:hypothetical protein
MRSDDGSLSFNGRLRCTARDRSRCFLPDLKGGASYLAQSFPLFEHRSTFFGLYHDGDFTEPFCRLEAVTPYVRDLGVGALGGTFTCADVNGAGSFSGAIGLAVDSCAPCVLHS